MKDAIVVINWVNNDWWFDIWLNSDWPFDNWLDDFVILQFLLILALHPFMSQFYNGILLLMNDKTKYDSNHDDKTKEEKFMMFPFIGRLFRSFLFKLVTIGY